MPFKPPIKGLDYYQTASGTSDPPATTVVSETTPGQSPAVGTATSYAREDHTHGTPSGGVGDVVGPAGAVDGNLPIFDTTTGKLIKDSGFDTNSFDSNGAAGAVQSNLTTHEGLTATVHNFDASGDAPAQAHGASRHTGNIGTESQVTFSTSGHEHTGADSNIVNYGLSPNSTGTLIGNAVTKNADPVYFDLTEGYQEFVDNTTDPLNPTRTVIYVGSQSHVTVTNLATWAGTYLGVNVSGTLIQQQTEFTSEQRRTISPLAFLFHSNNVNIKSVLPMHHFAADAMARLNDLSHAIGIMNLSGNQYYANGANLDINKTVGISYAIGTNFQTSRTKPDMTDDPAQTPVGSIPHSYRSTGDGWTQSSFQGMDTTYYDDGSGTLAAIPSGKWVAVPIYYIPGISSDSTGGSRIQYPQRYFDTQADAVASVPDDSYIKNPNLGNASIRTYCIVQQGATVLNSATYAVFKQVGKFSGAVVGGGAGAGEANTASNVGTAGVGLYNGKVGVDLQFKNAEAGSGKFSVTDYPTNKTVKLDVVTGTTSSTVCIGDDSRLSDARTPITHDNTKHSATYITIDSVTDANLSTSDITTNNFSTAKHGFVPKGTNVGNYLKDDGTWAAVAGGPGGLALSTIEINLGTKLRRAGTFDITSSGLTSGRPVLVFQALGPYTGKSALADSDPWERITAFGKTTSTTNIRCFWESQTRIKGNVKFNYVAG